MPNDFAIWLWVLKFGALVNLYFLARTLGLDPQEIDLHIAIPAQILFAVSAYRCLFPNRYKDNVVLHDSLLSSTFVTRVLATFTEVAWIYQFSHVLRVLDVEQVAWVEGLSWLMVLAVSISQLFVWGAILTGRLSLYFYEEIGWAVIFVANTIASFYLYQTVDLPGNHLLLLQLNLLFGAVYLPWQAIHLRALRADAREAGRDGGSAIPLTLGLLAGNLRRSIRERKRATDAAAWGGVVGLTWMTAYWAALIPGWVYQVVIRLGAA
jgi:hypothetical protein